MKRSAIMAMLCGAWITAALLVSGCESTESADDTIFVDPPTAQLVGKNASVVLKASLANTNDSLLLPLQWRVSNAGIGGIGAAEGITAVYVSNGKSGNNTITVNDQLGRSGVASITQVQPTTTTNAP